MLRRLASGKVGSKHSSAAFRAPKEEVMTTCCASIFTSMEVEMKKTMGRDSGVLSKHLVKNDDNNYMMKTKSSGTGREAKTEGHSKDLFGPDSHPRLHRKKLSPAPRRMIPLFWDTILSATKPTKNAAQHQKPSTTTTTTTTMTTTTTRTRTRRTSNKQQTPTYIFCKASKDQPCLFTSKSSQNTTLCCRL